MTDQIWPHCHIKLMCRWVQSGHPAVDGAQSKQQEGKDSYPLPHCPKFFHPTQIQSPQSPHGAPPHLTRYHSAQGSRFTCPPLVLALVFVFYMHCDSRCRVRVWKACSWGYLKPYPPPLPVNLEQIKYLKKTKSDWQPFFRPSSTAGLPWQSMACWELGDAAGVGSGQSKPAQPALSPSNYPLSPFLSTTTPFFLFGHEGGEGVGGELVFCREAPPLSNSARVELRKSHTESQNS